MDDDEEMTSSCQITSEEGERETIMVTCQGNVKKQGTFTYIDAA